MRVMLTGFVKTAVGSPRIWRKRALYLSRCTAAVLLVGWLAIRLLVTYLPSSPNNVVYVLGGEKLDPTAATVQGSSVDLPRLQEQVRGTARAVLPSVVAVKAPYEKSLGENYASGVIVTADGIVLSQGHVSHWKLRNMTQPDTSFSGKAGDRTTVILHDGRECPAELLGADRTHDVSLLRFLEPGPYPHVPIRPSTSVKVGDWVLKIGHPFGYQESRSAPVRLGRVIWGTAEIFTTDCMMAGGDSGGPYFSLDGELVGVPFLANGYPMVIYGHDPDFVRRDGGHGLFHVTGSKRIDSLMDAMLRGAIAPYDRKESLRSDRELAGSQLLQPADFSQGSATLARYRSIVEPTHLSVVVMLNSGVAVGLGTIVGADGWVVAKASELPDHPTCRLPDGKVVSARVAGVAPAFDLALISVPATDLKPVRWADDFNPPVGTLLAAVGTEGPLAVGVVSVPRRDLGAPVRPIDLLPLRLPAGGPQIYGGSKPITGYSLRAVFGLPRATVYQVWGASGLAYSIGIRRDDLLHTINGHQILTDDDILEAVHHQRTGDVVPVRLERAETMMDMRLPLAPNTRYDDTNYRSDAFPMVIECAVPFYSYECGGPVVDLAGRTVGITIGRPGPHGGMVIPGDCVLRLLPDLRSGRFAESWAPDRPAGKAER